MTRFRFSGGRHVHRRPGTPAVTYPGVPAGRAHPVATWPLRRAADPTTRPRPAGPTHRCATGWPPRRSPAACWPSPCPRWSSTRHRTSRAEPDTVLRLRSATPWPGRPDRRRCRSAVLPAVPVRGTRALPPELEVAAAGQGGRAGRGGRTGRRHSRERRTTREAAGRVRRRPGRARPGEAVGAHRRPVPVLPVRRARAGRRRRARRHVRAPERAGRRLHGDAVARATGSPPARWPTGGAGRRLRASGGSGPTTATAGNGCPTAAATPPTTATTCTSLSPAKHRTAPRDGPMAGRCR